MGRGSEDFELGVDFEIRNKDMEIRRLRKKVRKLQKAMSMTAAMVEGEAAKKWLERHIDSLMEQEP